LGGVLGPLVTGVIFDATGSYSVALGIFLVLVLVAAGLMLPLRVLATDREAFPAAAVRA
jgi:cyanate permease